MTKEQFQTLEKHSDLLHSVAKTLTMVGVDFNVIEELNNVYTGLGYRPTNIRCNECRIGMILTLHRLYEENKGSFIKSRKNEKGKLQTNGKKSGVKNDRG